MMDLAKPFFEHISKLRSSTEGYLRELNCEHLIIDAGVLTYHFADDQSLPFRPTPHFQHWCPLMSPGHLIHIHPGMKPRLFYYQPNDFWYETRALDNPYWANCFEISVINELDDSWKKVSGLKRVAYIGPQVKKAKEQGFDVNPANLVSRLDWQRSFKSSYEIQCLDLAQERASKGHQVAKSLFEQGTSELDIYHEYLRATQHQEFELPYTPIIALNEKGAYLHYQEKRRDRAKDVLLIDAGARFEAYCSDITRTYCHRDVPETFKFILKGLERAQLELCDAVRPKLSWSEFHDLAMNKVAQLVLDTSLLVNVDADKAIDTGLVRCFFPHGIGHLLGIQTHDVGGQQADAAGTQKPPPERYPKLRTTRDLEPSMVLTVEPGVYFIEMLLNPYREHKHSSFFNWPLIDELMPYGGMRIEDNIVVTDKGHQNLTRKYLS